MAGVFPLISGLGAGQPERGRREESSGSEQEVVRLHKRLHVGEAEVAVWFFVSGCLGAFSSFACLETTGRTIFAGVGLVDALGWINDRRCI